MNTPPASEFRHHERHTLSIRAKVTAFSSTGTTPVLEYMTGNISAGGAFMETSKPLPIASKVRIEFLLSLEEITSLKFILSMESLRLWKKKRIWVKASGVVIRAQATGMAIVFDQDYQLSPMDVPSVQS